MTTADDFERGVAMSGATAELMPMLPLAALSVLTDVSLSEDETLLLYRSNGPSRELNVPRDLLYRFARLSSASDVLGFAKRFGVLNLCYEHDLPRLHRRPSPSNPLLPFCDLGVLVNKPGTIAERVAAWLAFARQARMLLDHATALRQGTAIRAEWTIENMNLIDGAMPLLVGRELHYHSGGAVSKFAMVEQWRDQRTGKLTDAASDRENIRAFEWEAMVGVAESWIEWGAVAPAIVTQKPGRAKLILGGTPLFGALAMQLVTALSGTGFAICVGCNQPYSPSRRPRAREDSYCDGCRRRGKAGAAAVTRHHERLRQAREFVASGVPLDEVASRTGMRLSTVRKHFGRPSGSRKRR